MDYLILILVTLGLGCFTQIYINSSYKKYSKLSNPYGMTGAQIARKMLDDNGLNDVFVRRVSGTLTDHYDPSKRVVNLSEGVYDQESISALAVACHECGHAVQHARGYVPMSIRSALVPVANFGSSAWMILLIIGIVLNLLQLVWLAIIFYSFAVLFHIVTLPVEFNASHRGLDYIKNSGMLVADSDTYSGARTVLRAAALTYVAAALTSVMQLLYYAAVFMGSDN